MRGVSGPPGTIDLRPRERVAFGPKGPIFLPTPDHNDRNTWGMRAYKLMRLGFCFYILTFPLGMAFREIGGITAAVSLVLYYGFCFRDSNLSRFRLKWIYFLFLGLIVFKTLNTTHFSSSWYVFHHNIYKGFALFLVGLEFVRERRDLRTLMILFVIMGFYLGLDGIYQYFTGYDFIRHVPSSGRLGATFETGRVGNLISLALPMTFCLPLILPGTWGAWKRRIASGLLAFPGFFLLVGAQARSGWFGFAAALFGFFWVRQNAKKAILCTLIFLAALFVFNPGQLSPSAIAGDARWEIWSACVDIFKTHPALGSGLNTFEPAYKALGVTFDPARFDLPIPHPHNVYLQFLAETGIIGALIFLVFSWGYLAFCAQRIRARMPLEKDGYWVVAACFFSSYLGYLITAISAHNYFRTWWLGMAMCVMGVAVGACIDRESAPKA